MYVEVLGSHTSKSPVPTVVVGTIEMDVPFVQGDCM